MNAPWNERYRTATTGRLVQPVLSTLLLLTAMVTFVPFSPGMPAAGLDHSWMLAINQAVAQGLSFGDQVIFTFGPYSSIYTRLYHPATDAMILAASVFLALSYWCSLVVVTYGVRWPWIVSFCVISLAGTDSRDATFFLQPLLATLATYQIVPSSAEGLRPATSRFIWVAVLLAPLGLLPLVKGSMLVLCNTLGALCVLFALAHRRIALAVMCALSPVLSMLLFWTAAGQSVAALPRYITNIADLAGGYAQAMAMTGRSRDIAFYVVACAALLATVLAQSALSKTSRLFICCAFGSFLFVAFKAGFVRHDVHALAAGNSVLLAAVILPFSVPVTAAVLPAVFVALVSRVDIDHHYAQISAATAINALSSVYSATRTGISHSLNRGDWLRPQFDTAVERLALEAALPVLPGTTDIYSFNQSYLIASGNAWSPRPVFQSYVAYIPALAEANGRHLSGDRAPDNIIFRVEPVGLRLPSLEDGVSWPVLLSRYRPVQFERDSLVLARRENEGNRDGGDYLLRSRRRFGESVSIPPADGPLFAQVAIRPTLPERVGSFLFKPGQLKVRLQLRNGEQREYDLIPGMAAAGFVASPLIESTREFVMLYGRQELLERKQVSSLEIRPAHGPDDDVWKSEYTITFSRLKDRAPLDVSSLLGIDLFEPGLPAVDALAAEACRGSIDAINGAPPAAVQLSAAALLRLDGWLVVSVDPAIMPDAVYLVVTDSTGKRKYVRTRLSTRPDVAAHFNKPGLERAGFTVAALVSGLNGTYTLGLAIEYSNRLSICQQFNIAATIGP
jgi:hypothetical protein